MIAELIEDIGHKFMYTETDNRMTDQRMLFPEPAKRGAIRRHVNSTSYAQTFAMEPQQGALRLPFLIDVLVENPHCGSLVLRVARDVVICRGIRRGQPSLEVLNDPLPYNRCEFVQVFTMWSWYEQSRELISFAICCTMTFVSFASNSKTVNMEGQ